MVPADQTLWLLVSTALLALAVPGVALFYGGMVRRKNIMNTIALPFNKLGAKELCPGKATLDKINASLR